MRRRFPRRLPLLLPVLLLCGCLPSAAAPEPAADVPDERATRFDPTATGTITGQVAWEGDVPTPPAIRFHVNAYNPHLNKTPSVHAHPHVPQVNPQTGGVSGAVVFLRDVDPRRARPWHHGPVRVELAGRELTVTQDGTASKVGFVRRGDTLEVVRRGGEFQSLKARGGAFFTLPFAEPDRPARRQLTAPGLVEFSSGAGFYWLHGHLFVADHPYYTRTDVDGRFTLDQVPAGEYEVVCWLPNWRVERKERDPESGLPVRWFFAPPAEQRQAVRVIAGRGTGVRVARTAAHFASETRPVSPAK